MQTGRLKMQDWKMTDESAGLESPALSSVIFQSCIFQSCIFSAPMQTTLRLRHSHVATAAGEYIPYSGHVYQRNENLLLAHWPAG